MTTPDIDRIRKRWDRLGALTSLDVIDLIAAVDERDKSIASLRTEWRVAGMKIRALGGGWTTETSNWYQSRQMAESVMRVRGGRSQCRYVSEPEDVK